MKGTVNNRRTELRGKWLLTFNDMITLLLTFFVLIISMSHIETTKVKEVAASARKVLGMKESEGDARSGAIVPFVIPTLDEDIERAREKKGSGGAGLLDKKETLSRSFRRLKGVSVLPVKGGLSLSLNEPLLFAPGSADIMEKGRLLLNALGDYLQRSDVLIQVEGNTDDLPIATDKYPSNWELSMARAVNIVKYLSSRVGISPVRLSAAGYADTRPKAPNVNPENRQLNRRVDIILTFP